MLIRACELIEKSGLPAVLVSHQREGQYMIGRKRLFRALVMMDARLTQGGMGFVLFSDLPCTLLRKCFYF